MTYFKDHRQEIADSWPHFIKDYEAQKDWGWKPEFGLSEMVAEIIDQIKSNNYPSSQTA